LKAKLQLPLCFFMNKLLLRLALLPARLWEKAGVDLTQLRAILEVKLKMDDRKPLNFGRQQTKKRNRRFSSVLGMLVSFFTGIIYIFPLIILPDRLFGLLSFFTVFLFLLTFTLIADFSNVLIDTRDKFIVLPRPVSDRTLAVSRMLHVGIYLFRIVLPMSLPGWIAVGMLDGWRAVLWFPLPLLLLLFTSLFLVMGIYMLILRVAAASRFRDILSYFQIAFSITLFGFYYLMPRAMDSTQVASLKIGDYPWLKLFPSYWLAATWSWIHPHALPSGTFLYSILALLLPLVLIGITLKWLAPAFAANLGRLYVSEGSMPTPGKTKKAGFGQAWQKLAALLNKRPEAQAGFIMTWLQSARSRSFKLKIYPVFAYIPIYFVYLLSLNKDQSLSSSWASLSGSGKHITLLYMSCVVVLQALGFSTVSEQYRASWIYYSVPLYEPGALMAGAFKAMWVKYFLPFFMAISAFVLFIWGMKALPDVLLALVNATLFAVCTVRVAYRQFPFSQAEQMSNAGSKFLRVFVSLTIPGALGVGHYLALELLWLKMIFLVLSLILLWLVWDSYAHTGWADLKKQ
jgi:hypothetical protein